MSIKELKHYELASSALLNRPDAKVLDAEEERKMLLELSSCKTRLIEEYYGGMSQAVDQSGVAPDIQDIVRELLNGPVVGKPCLESLRPIAAHYNELRTRLAMANLRLVAHVARKYRDRGISPSDLLQDGFCGLLTGIDRYDPANETRLASYAVWWIRQAIQRAVAAGAYPVRLNPRHLQKLAQNGPDGAAQGSANLVKTTSASAVSTIRKIHSATKPTVSLDAPASAGDGSCLLEVLTYPPQEEEIDLDRDEFVGSMMEQLKPRERQVLQLRFGLDGKACHSLSQVSEILDVSKERIRQIQEAAIRKLRTMARSDHFCALV